MVGKKFDDALGASYRLVEKVGQGATGAVWAATDLRTGERVAAKLLYLSSASGIGDLFVRAILCNFMINLAMLLIYNGFIREDWSKIFSMIMAVFVFAFLGFEHSVANTVLFTVIGLTHGIDVLPALGNVAVALLGNFVGGGLLIGGYYAYANDDSRWLGRQLHKDEVQAGK